MKIKQIGSYNGDIISTILENRNIDNVELFLNPNDDNNLDVMKLTNMKKGAEILLAHINVRNKIGLLIDPDADGFTSSTILYQYIKKINPEIEIIHFLHEGKSHGLTEPIIEQIANTDIDLLIIPDAGSNDNEAISKVHHMGIEILIIDHHEVENQPEFAILINNQVDGNEETNKNLVGAGMVLKFCKALDQILSVDYAKEFYDLAAIGQVGDASDISESEIRNIVFKGLNKITNPFIETALKEYFEDLSTIAPINLSFSIIPLINAAVRVGTQEEKELLFRAMNSIDADEMWEIPKRRKNKETGKFDKVIFNMNLYEYCLDVLQTIRSRQASLVKKTMAELLSKIDNTGGIAICVLDMPDKKTGSVTGLIANKIASKLRKPTLIVHYIDGKYMGSGRGYEKILPSLKDWCKETELTEYALGHANAFGISILEKDFKAFKEKLKEVEKEEFIYEVDAIIDKKVDKEIIIEIDRHRKLFGGQVHHPLIAFTNIHINKSFIRQRGSMLTFFDNGVEFVMYAAPDGFHEELTHNFESYIPMNFVGRPNIAIWSGKEKIQLILEDCERVIESEIQEVTTETIIF